MAEGMDNYLQGRLDRLEAALRMINALPPERMDEAKSIATTALEIDAPAHKFLLEGDDGER